MNVHKPLRFMITARNQSDRDMGGKILNETELKGEINGVDNFVIDPKGRRMETRLKIKDSGPVNMQTDRLEPINPIRITSDPKNLTGGGL